MIIALSYTVRLFLVYLIIVRIHYEFQASHFLSVRVHHFFVGGAFLEVSLEVLSGRIHSIIGFVRRSKVDPRLLNKLEIMLLSVKGVLNDAEKKQVTDSAVRQWLQKLNDAIHDAEDLVDEINTEALRCQIEGNHSQSSRTGAFLFKKHLGLSEGVEPITSFRRSCATALVEESDIYGRDADKQAIIDFLLSEASEKLSVIPIVGMGGIGKTTLAQLVYQEIDDKVMEKPFENKAWITVSEESDVFRLTKKIYEAVTNSANSTFKETFQLQLKLKELLDSKKFLLVLDDVWNVDYRRWCDLRSSFESLAHGSKIIVTTRNTKVASDLGTVPKHDLQILSVEDCWKLFKKHAFDNVDPSANLDLEVIGRQIVQKCNGLPLAVKSLGSLLHSVQDLKDWENVLKNDIWDLPECDILPALWLSYNYLPSHLKRCFAYCSIFPKDYVIEKKKLILLWMAQDLLQPHKRKIPEEVGKEYFDHLVSRSFFNYNGNGEFTTMHDLVNDLAMFVSGKCCLRLEDNNSDVPIKETRHFSYLGCSTYGEKNIKDLYENKVLRTLINLETHKVSVRDTTQNFEHLQSMQFLRVLSLSKRILRIEVPRMKLNSIGNLKLLRYLDLSYFKVEEIPDSIGTLYNLQTFLLRFCCGFTSLPDSVGNLKHLRYLDLSRTPIERLPDTICQLHELHTLILRGCWKFTHLPTNTATLVNLRNLDINWTMLTEMPTQMSNLNNLQTLTNFIVGKNTGSNIMELGKLKDLHGCLRISGLENILNVEDVYSEANLIDKKNITELELKWNGYIDDSQKGQMVLDRLRPHSDLEVLSIENYGGTRFSDWVGHPSFSCMKSVKLVGCENCYMVPPLGQLPSLEHLEIKRLDKLRRIGDEFYSDSSSCSLITKPFKSLKSLKISSMAEWEEWALVEVDGGVFTDLKELWLWDCPKLKGSCLPDYLPSLETLKIRKSTQLVASLSRCRYPSLHLLGIENCPKMKTFPGAIILPSEIQRIKIDDCAELVSLSEEGWPANLKSLEIENCQHTMQWNLGMLTSLTSLDIGSIFEEMEAFPKEEGQLPTTLTSLSLFALNALKSLNGSALQRLTSLQYLSIFGCDHIQCLPQQGLPTTLTSLGLWSLPNLKSLNGDTFRHLTSLQYLTIQDCPQLHCLPRERLPESLSKLDIRRCPLLKPRCQRGTGEDWPYIRHIPRITIDFEDI
ncbi:putative disease resistance RPP13-like protein 1 isoform X2 [Ziziphus jujuba]|uniref:Disease resistance RPP13-like protein 1 isoform X2 n=1 Tax=Ziziphus jujuba TaxID=326968 RepID=A0ABM3IKN6_ZIZJJ|nr:putative disease resistance RPP13-like protein 1 isoform X2 [Ziziphus jujuba]